VHCHINGKGVRGNVEHAGKKVAPHLLDLGELCGLRMQVNRRGMNTPGVEGDQDLGASRVRSRRCCSRSSRVLDLDVSTTESPNNLGIWKVIATDAASMSHYALDLAPQAALEEGGSVDRLLSTIRTRLAVLLPELTI
jgi:hypothetical protein